MKPRLEEQNSRTWALASEERATRSESLAAMRRDLLAQIHSRSGKILKDGNCISHFVRLLDETMRHSCTHVGVIHAASKLPVGSESDRRLAAHNRTQTKAK